MKVSVNKEKQGFLGGRVIYDSRLDNLPIPKAALEKAERARKTLEKHPIPEHILKK